MLADAADQKKGYQNMKKTQYNTNKESFNLYQLDDFLDLASTKLCDAVHQSKHDYHHFYVASTNLDHSPTQRTVILRHFDLKRQSIIFHSDFRSEKIKHLNKNPNISLLFYSKKYRLQLVFNAICHIHNQDRLALRRFETSSEYSKQCYASPLKPKTPIKTHRIQTETELDFLDESQQYKHFCACVCNFTKLHLLWLNKRGNIAANYTWDKHGKIHSHWVST